MTKKKIITKIYLLIIKIRCLDNILLSNINSLNILFKITTFLLEMTTFLLEMTTLLLKMTTNIYIYIYKL